MVSKWALSDLACIKVLHSGFHPMATYVARHRRCDVSVDYYTLCDIQDARLGAPGAQKPASVPPLSRALAPARLPHLPGLEMHSVMRTT